MSKTGIILLLVLLCVNGHLMSQDYYEQKEKEIDQLYGFDKLAILNLLTVHYSGSNSRKARKYGKEANLMADEFMASRREFTLEEVELIIDSKLRYAKVLFNRETYEDAQIVFESSKSGALAYDYVVGIDEAEKYLHMLDSLIVNESEEQNFLKRAISDLKIGSAISNSANNVATSSELKLAQLAENRGDTATAIVHYEKARDLLENRGELAKADEIGDKILTFRAIQHVDSIKTYIAQQENDRSDGKVLDHKIELDSTGSFVLVNVDTSQLIEQQVELEQLKVMAQRSEQAQDYEASLSYYKQFLILQQKYQEDSAMRVAAIKVTDAELNLLVERNKNADLNIAAIQKEKEAEVQLKNILMVVAVMIALATLFVLFMYLSKIQKHRQLTSAYGDLDAAKGKLETAERHISNLLRQQVSPEIASVLIQDTQQRRQQFVAIMFLDIRGFTPIAEKMDPEQLIEYQNNVFGFMIEIIQKRHGNINQFMGDGFMATFGAPVSHGNDPRNAYLAGVEILEGIKRLNMSGDIPETMLGIGIHAGFVVTGNVGTESRKQFSITGSTVIIAARVEQLNKTYDSQMIITEEVYKSLTSKDVGAGTPEMESVNVKGRAKPVKIIIVDKAHNLVSEKHN